VYTGGNISYSSNNNNNLRKPISIKKLTAENLRFLKQVGLRPKLFNKEHGYPQHHQRAGV
jgi:hypothetical protein